MALSGEQDHSPSTNAVSGYRRRPRAAPISSRGKRARPRNRGYSAGASTTCAVENPVHHDMRRRPSLPPAAPSPSAVARVRQPLAPGRTTADSSHTAKPQARGRLLRQAPLSLEHADELVEVVHAPARRQRPSYFGKRRLSVAPTQQLEHDLAGHTISTVAFASRQTARPPLMRTEFVATGNFMLETSCPVGPEWRHS